MIQLRKHQRPVWYRVEVHYTRQDCQLSFPVQARSLEEARLKALHEYLPNREIEVRSVSLGEQAEERSTCLDAQRAADPLRELIAEYLATCLQATDLPGRSRHLPRR